MKRNETPTSNPDDLAPCTGIKCETHTGVEFSGSSLRRRRRPKIELV